MQHGILRSEGGWEAEAASVRAASSNRSLPIKKPIVLILVLLGRA